MKKTIKLYKHEHYKFSDGSTLDRDSVTVEPFAKTIQNGKERTVWADVDDDSCLYTIEAGLLWRFDGDLF